MLLNKNPNNSNNKLSKDSQFLTDGLHKFIQYSTSKKDQKLEQKLAIIPDAKKAEILKSVLDKNFLDSDLKPKANLHNKDNLQDLINDSIDQAKLLIEREYKKQFENINLFNKKQTRNIGLKSFYQVHIEPKQINTGDYTGLMTQPNNNTYNFLSQRKFSLPLTSKNTTKAGNDPASTVRTAFFTPRNTQDTEYGRLNTNKPSNCYNNWSNRGNRGNHGKTPVPKVGYTDCHKTAGENKEDEDVRRGSSLVSLEKNIVSFKDLDYDKKDLYLSPMKVKDKYPKVPDLNLQTQDPGHSPLKVSANQHKFNIRFSTGISGREKTDVEKIWRSQSQLETSKANDGTTSVLPTSSNLDNYPTNPKNPKKVKKVKNPIGTHVPTFYQLNYEDDDFEDMRELRMSLVGFRDKSRLFNFNLYNNFNNQIDNKRPVDINKIALKFKENSIHEINKRPFFGYRRTAQELSKLKELSQDQINYFLNAIKIKNYDMVIRCLSDNDNYVKGFDYVGMTCLHWSTSKEDKMLTKAFIDMGANVNAKDLQDRTPIFFAVKAQNFSLVRVSLFL